MAKKNEISRTNKAMQYKPLLATVADSLTDYLSGIDYKHGQDKDMDRVIELLGIEFGHDDVGELYWYYNGC